MDRPPFWALLLGAVAALSCFLAALALWRRRKPPLPLHVSLSVDKPIRVQLVAEVRSAPALPQPEDPKAIQFAPAERRFDPDALTQPLIKRSKPDDDPGRTVSINAFDDALQSERLAAARRKDTPNKG